jgi:dTDP-6-deoxy-L-talose 4-dehydrogenase (NAD+)
LPNYKSLHHFEVELPRQFRFLKSMVDGGLQSLLVAGTCLEYGMQSGLLSEDLPTIPNNPYGQAKDALRKQLVFLKSVKPFAFMWARLFYVYGDGQAKTSLYSQLKEAVRSGDHTFNMSGGEQLRDYLPISEVARKIASLALSRRDVGTINICSGKPISVRKLVEQWIAENQWPIRLNLGHYPYPDYEPMAFWGDASKIAAICGER